MLERMSGPWDYKVQPNKLLELVKNVGGMEQERTGYYVESESEMLTILAYLNYGEKTNITEGMITQIDQAVKQLEGRHLHKKDEYDDNGPKLGGEEYELTDGPVLGLNGFTNDSGATLGLGNFANDNGPTLGLDNDSTLGLGNFEQDDEPKLGLDNWNIK